MSVKGALLAVMLGGCAAAAPAPQASAPAGAVSGKEHAAQCKGRDGWSDAAPLVQVYANVWQVGTCGIVALLVTSDAGHILIDAATDEAAPGIARNIERLGFKLSDVKIILNGHEHLDHAGGIGALQRMTGARLLARAPARAALESGEASADDPQLGMNPKFPGAHVDGIVADGEVVRLGPLALTAHATPGHTPGSTSWSWRSCAGAECRDIVYADSISALSNDSYRFSDHPAYVAAFRAGLDRLAGLKCDVLITPHPGASDFHARLAGTAPLVDAKACANYAAGGRARLDTRLAKEQTR